MSTDSPLKAAFLEFDWVKDAENFLTEISKGNLEIAQQITQRCVRKIKSIPLLVSAGIILENGFFTIVFEETVPDSEKPGWLGHELAHTFHLVITNNKVIDMVPNRNTDGEIYDQVEDFCQAFSDQWLALNSVSGVQQFIQNYSNKNLF